MALMHHNDIRANAQAPDDDAQMAVLHDNGWRAGPHKDTDPDDDSPVPRVLPAADPEPEPKAVKATKKEVT